MSSNALIFIPDISGYTEFVTQTENRHSNHIISKLLEIIIQSNQLGLIVSEIEGDAVLFYKKGDLPKIEDLLVQAKIMFTNFHAHLKIIQRDNVCQCGACRTAINLTLKFITHYGTLNETVIQNFTKIVGGDVILAHRLLKNKLDEREYLLITENYLSTQILNSSIFENWVNFIPHTEYIESFEDVATRYTSLTELKNHVPEVPPKPILQIQKRDRIETIFISAPILFVHEVLTDNDAKMNYVPGLKSIKNSGTINRLNGTHTCVFEDLQIHFVTQANEVTNDKINYSEQAELNLGVSFITDYMLEENEKGTNLSVSIFPNQKYDNNYSRINKIFFRLKTVLIMAKIKSSTKKRLELFKVYCERVYNEQIRTGKVN